MQLSIVLIKHCGDVVAVRRGLTTSIGAGGDQLIECVSAIKYGHAEFDAEHIYLEVTFFSSYRTPACGAGIIYGGSPSLWGSDLI